MSRKIHISAGKKDIFFDTDEIAFIEVLGNKCDFHFRDGRTETGVRITIKKVMEEIKATAGSYANHHLFMAGRSDILNLDCITGVNSDKGTVSVQTTKLNEIILTKPGMKEVLQRLNTKSPTRFFRTVASQLKELTISPDIINGKVSEKNYFHSIDLGLPSGTHWAPHNVFIPGLADNIVSSQTNILDGEDVWLDIVDDYPIYEKSPVFHESIYCGDSESEAFDAAKDEFIDVYNHINSWLDKHWVKPSKEQWEELIRECEWTPYRFKSKGEEEIGVLVKGPNGKYLNLPISFSKKLEADYLVEDGGGFLKIRINMDGLNVEIAPDEPAKGNEKTHRGMARLVCKKLPEKVEDSTPKTTIFNKEFEGRTDLECIDVPSTVTSIGWSAFEDCKSLKTVTLHDGLKIIGQSAFKDCKSLTEIEIPATVDTIGEEAFIGCEALTRVWIKGARVIERFAFRHLENIEQLVLPNNLEKIGARAFHGLNSLKSLNVKSLVTLDGWALCYCKNLKEVSLPDNLQTLGLYAFRGCESLEKVNIKHVDTIEKYAFQDCIRLQVVNISSDIHYIDPTAFEGCSSLQHIFVPESSREKVKSMLPANLRRKVAYKL